MNYRNTIDRKIVILIILILLHFLIDYPANAQEGTLKWKFPFGDLGESTASSPAIGADGTIYVGIGKDFYSQNNNGKLLAINPDGTQKWVFYAGDFPINSSPSIGADGTIYIGSQRPDKLHAINPDGTEKWSFSTGGDYDISSSPSIASDGTIYLGTNELYAINPDGTQKWAFPIHILRCSPAIGLDGTIYVQSFDPFNLYAINPDGTQKWAYPLTFGYGYSYSPPSIAVDGTIYVGSLNGNLYAINPDGTQKWEFSTGDEIRASPTIGSDGTIYVPSLDDKLYAINPDGTQKWAIDIWADLSSPAIGADGIIYISHHYLYAINPDGSQKWKYNIPVGDPLNPAIGADGTIYIPGYEYLYAINSSSMGLANSSWPMFMHDAKHTGRAGSPIKFEDVPPVYWAEDAIYKIYEAGITKGCSQDPLMFCPTKTVYRDQMAVFLGRATHDSNFTPPDATGIFADVPTWYWAADWIEQFYADGLTKGCKVDPHSAAPVIYYCPKYPVTRTTMAVFLLRAKHGANYEPPPAKGIFGDVWINYWAAAWIEQLYKEGITKGCKQNPLMYCPSKHVTRAQMAVFLARMLGL